MGMMKTTLDIHDALLDRAKRHAKKTGRPLRAIVEDGLRQVLAVPVSPHHYQLPDLKELLTLAKEVVQSEKQVDPVDEQAKAKAALTELFAEVKNGKTPMGVERIVTDIDEIVRLVRFPGWQNTKA